MDIELIKLLKQTGFTEKESRVYLALLELGSADITDIAKKAALKRSIVYVIVGELIEKGYATQLPNRKINTYQAVDPGVILNQVKTTSKNLAEMIPYLRSLADKSAHRPKIHFIDTKEGIYKIYNDMNNYQDQFFLSSYSKIEEHYPGAIKGWVANFKKGHYNFRGRHLIPDNPDDLKHTQGFLSIGQTIKVMSGIDKIKMDLSIFGNKLAITSFEEKPFMVMIESQDLVDSLLPVMGIAWQSGNAVTMDK